MCYGETTVQAAAAAKKWTINRLEPTRERHTGIKVIVAMLLIARPVMYALRAGPAKGLVRNGTMTEAAYETLYWPVLKAQRFFGPVDEVGRRY